MTNIKFEESRELTPEELERAFEEKTFNNDKYALKRNESSKTYKNEKLEAYFNSIIPGYEQYWEKNQQHIKRVKALLSAPNIHWLKGKRYVCGVDIAPGEYFAMDGAGGKKSSIDIEKKKIKDKNGADCAVFRIDGERQLLNYFFYVEEGDVITLNNGAVMARAAELPALREEGEIIYEGGYRAGTEIPYGKYFFLSMDKQGADATFYTEKDIDFEYYFGCIEIKAPTKYIAFENAILLPIALKPDFMPLTREPLVYHKGFYLVGKDMPAGRYSVDFFPLEMPKNEDALTKGGYSFNGGLSYTISNDPLLYPIIEKGDIVRNERRIILRKRAIFENDGKRTYQYRWPDNKVYVEVRDGQYLKLDGKLRFEEKIE